MPSDAANPLQGALDITFGPEDLLTLNVLR